ncbi:MAG: NADH-quinone oxidoreductase subunit E [Acidimicrobiaceae bacterium]|nr:NADH-quinone oxidoreductase subunit E [Acidimicrobiaceae bacterium]MYD08134.1 NADH-quinone oxidoreductase subunit E [Acidimicrobiaceae bacterium]MYI60031.1 NADH-quinone oxidoreductase subunit E [Acidimicrobiaceae bacterium]
MADLFIGDDVADDIEIAAVATAIGAPTAVVHETERLVYGGTHRRHDHRHLLLPALHGLQNAKGWISPGGLNHVCEVLQVPPAEAYGVATFYEMFRLDEPEHRADVTHVAHVCVDAACQIAANEELIAELEANGEHVHRSPCLGQCERAPAQFRQGIGGPDSVPADTVEVARQIPQHGDPSLRLLRNVGVVDPTSLDAYRANGGYLALAKAIEMGPAEVCTAVAESGLSGRGGAAFPTGVKWRAVAAEQGRPKHVVANCDESEPGTFKDRIVMEQDPFAVIESLTLGGLATGAENGWIYIRGEYPLATARLENAVNQAREAGLLGADAAESGHRFDIEIRRGAGAYICGEETALFASLEGFRGEPRSKPPFPTTHGLFREPTAINNPETLINTLDIVLHGAEDYRSRGTERSPGTKLLCVSGRVSEPGLYEVEFGTTLGQVLDLAGPLTGSGTLAAVLMGGAAGSFVGPDALDMPLTLEDTRERGTTLGSGVVMAFTDEIDMTDVLVRIAEFFKNESCGQCVPCRVGTVRQHETMVQIQAKGSLSAQRRSLVDDIAEVMVDASICGLGHTAASAINSAMDLGLLSKSNGEGPQFRKGS